jgi:hypothetical protein
VFPTRKIEAALVAVLIAVITAVLDQLGAFDWGGLGPWGPVLGAGVATLVAYMRTDGIGWLKRHLGKGS